MKQLNSTKIFVLANGIFIGLTASIHGLSEILKGNISTGGVMLADMGAMTLIQNYLYSGIAVVITSMLLIAWCFTALNNRLFVLGYIVLCVVLFLTGGGAAFVLFFLLGLLASANMRKPAKGMARMLSGSIGEFLGRAWGPIIILAYFFIIAGVLVWLLFIPPGAVYEVSLTQGICWSFLLIGLLGMVLSIFAGIARDVRNDREPPSQNVPPTK